MAVVIARQKMTVHHAEGEHTIYPSAEPQSLPDHLLSHDFVQGAIQSGWITVQSATQPAAEEEAPAKVEEQAAPAAPRRKRNA